ncbi:hypothetical protein LINPERHAP1_LOCUS10262, partial [Linum perenne]
MPTKPRFNLLPQPFSHKGKSLSFVCTHHCRHSQAWRRVNRKVRTRQNREKATAKILEQGKRK